MTHRARRRLTRRIRAWRRLTHGIRAGTQGANQFRTAGLQPRLLIAQPGESLVHLPELVRHRTPQRQRTPRAPELRLLGPGCG
ncbi:hypothetical protein [Nonomuraea jiangxiensis]|uniref:hypothetical protein n=1 Tax=Nonomuraea jiangxiensis TaxID=633440 RepID=UPI000B83BBDF|nr:hypothetical protein [Nonomuraea jiangxiensis]